MSILRMFRKPEVPDFVCPHCLRDFHLSQTTEKAPCYPNADSDAYLCSGCKHWFLVDTRIYPMVASDQSPSYRLPPRRDDAAFHSIRNAFVGKVYG